MYSCYVSVTCIIYNILYGAQHLGGVEGRTGRGPAATARTGAVVEGLDGHPRWGDDADETCERARERETDRETERNREQRKVREREEGRNGG